jgi:hypothetical protein
VLTTPQVGHHPLALTAPLLVVEMPLEELELVVTSTPLEALDTPPLTLVVAVSETYLVMVEAQLIRLVVAELLAEVALGHLLVILPQGGVGLWGKVAHQQPIQLEEQLFNHQHLDKLVHFL